MEQQYWLTFPKKRETLPTVLILSCGIHSPVGKVYPRIPSTLGNRD